MKKSYVVCGQALALSAVLSACSSTGKIETVTVNGISVTKHVVSIDPKFNVAYSGNNEGITSAFPHGLPISLGSGLAYKGKDADGGLLFYVLTDRGPNADSPDLVSGVKTKVFPVPDFTPKFGIVKVKDDRATLLSMTDIKNIDGSRTTGLPKPSGVGSSGEAPLTEALQATLKYDDNGIDPEGVAIDAQGNLWMCDEYGPYLIQLDPKNGKILKKLAPTTGLPAVLQYRQPNRGFEGVAVTPNGKVYGVVQSPLQLPEAGKQNSKKAPFVRVVEYDPRSGATRMFAYTFDTSLYHKVGDIKLGDLVALSDTRFLLIEQGAQVDGIVHNMIVLIDLAGATDISTVKPNNLEAEYLGKTADLAANGIAPVKRSVLFDLRQKDAAGNTPFGWVAEKAEGLAVVDDDTIALANDNDFGMASMVADSTGAEVKGCTIDASGKLGGAKCTGNGAVGYKIIGNSMSERPSRLWLFKLPKKLSDYAAH